ncbi:hypothetical protein HPB50_022528 [Hyalomma asiaticum]|uniref:Uncharacterized protein n=1 Tax=Hyalomma asiaticum TaxID=266040 RepID=A0ACB7S2D0_HYAAI|nr:hypothetical protein HPB50_022528 [Hyalomma asiaticum]
MAVHTFLALDYVVLISFLVLSAGIGVFFAWHDRRGNSNRQFLTANRQLSWLPVSMSMMASFLSAASVLGVPSQVFVRGSTFWWGAVSTTLAILMAAFIFMPMYYEMDITSINELLYLGVALYGPSLALGSVTGLPVWSSILLNGVVCTFYTSIGGIKAVVWTDVVQVVLIYVAYIMVIASGLHHLGGFGAMWKLAGDGGRLIFANFDVSPYETYTVWAMVFGWTISWMGMYCANQTQAQRYTSIGSLKGARIALLLNVPGTILNVTMAVLSGLTLYAVYGRCDPRLTGDIRKADQLMPYIIQDKLHQYPGLGGLFAAAVYSSSLSGINQFYHISFMWVAFVGFVVHMIVSLAVSLAFEWSGSEVVDPKYVCPLVRKYMRNDLTVNNTKEEKVKETLPKVSEKCENHSSRRHMRKLAKRSAYAM